MVEEDPKSFSESTEGLPEPVELFPSDKTEQTDDEATAKRRHPASGNDVGERILIDNTNTEQGGGAVHQSGEDNVT